jgi:NTE family protein
LFIAEEIIGASELPPTDVPEGSQTGAAGATSGEQRTRAFGIFEGGGAKGIAHVGALKAAELEEIDFVGFAGTSAGAMVAALAAAGFTADELLRCRPTCTHVLETVCNAGPLHLFGVAKWRRFRRFQEYCGQCTKWPKPIPLPQTWSPCNLLKGLGIFLIDAVIIPFRIACWVLFFLVGAVLHGLRLRKAIRDRGWFDTALVRTHVNALLHHKLVAPFESFDRCRDVLFSDLPISTPLRIVATDIDRKSMKVFTNVAATNHPATPDVAIADAVCASISVPFVFAPKPLDNTRLLDVGMASNLPVWLFDEERLDRPGLPTIAFTLGEDAPGRGASLLEFLTAVARSAIFGGQSVGLRGIDNLVVVAVPSDIDLLAFDADWETVSTIYDAAHESARDVLAKSLVLNPQIFNGICKVIYDGLTARALQMTPPQERRIRVNIVRRVSPRYLRIQFNYGMGYDADDIALLPIARTISGEAWKEKKIICRSGPGNMKFAKLDDAEDKYRQAMIWKNLASVLSLPVFREPDAWKLDPSSRPEPIAILNVDSDKPLDDFMADVDVLEFLQSASERIGRELAEKGYLEN